jgi:isoleucyl-tRNA synthetase
VLGDWNNPYLTMSPAYQAAIVRALGKFVDQGMVYKGKKPVHWCIHCRTALAEAEVEYESHSSPSIYVEFPLDPVGQPEVDARFPALRGRRLSALIWTTTPWTIPSNLALAFHPDLDYGAYEVDGGVVVVATALASQVAGKTRKVLGEPVLTMQGRAFEGLPFRHPLYDRPSVGVLAEYVTLEQGTGVVHTAPGHGADDYRTGVRYGLDIYAPVDAGGHFADDVGIFAGMGVFDANPRVEAALAERGRLWSRETFEHSYPHCWRCHNPVIFLATAQWFIAMDRNGLRERALQAVRGVTWVPGWGLERIWNMLANRPDWCISRQRAWGVPIPALNCARCGEASLTPALVERAATVFEAHGADAWYERPIEDFLVGGLTCTACGD